MNEVACNYAVSRFRPYRETGEFVNVGVVLMCSETGFFDYRFAAGLSPRISNFFPDLDINVFQAGLTGLLQELARVTARERDEHLHPPVLREGTPASLARFRELVRPREALFFFGEVGTVMAADPRATLEEFFQRCVQRQRDPQPPLCETVLRER